ncbi:MAG: metal-dependent transcriptional regulator [Saprospiraceae bacterium]|nr:metal-dependent transcriptional regulator [Saprospiraceae bacterium]MDW8484587.1 metal-dependent transcriptional regulator [Saprospiraceae bacterium]
MYTSSEEDYLKAILKLSRKENGPVTTGALATELHTAAPSVTDMIRRLAEKRLATYERYHGVQLTDEGLRIATALVRRHRLWEVFLTEKLGFPWDAVHEVAEQLEHVQHPDLIERLDAFLGYPRFDPHGDPIPNAQGVWPERQRQLLSTVEVGVQVVIAGVDDHSVTFLQHLDRLGINLGTRIAVLERVEYDLSLYIHLVEQNRDLMLSDKAARSLFVEPIN